MSEDEVAKIPDQSDRAHKRLSALLQRRGLEGIDPKSDEGRYIHMKVMEYLEMASTDIPDTMKEKIVRIAVEAEIMKNSMYTHLMSLRPVAGFNQESKAKRDAFKAASSAYRMYISIMMDSMKALTSGNVNDDTPEDLDARLAKLSGKK